MGCARICGEPGQRGFPAARWCVASAVVRAHPGDRVDADHGRPRCGARFLRLRARRARACVDRRGARIARRVAAGRACAGHRVRDRNAFRVAVVVGERRHARARRRAALLREPDRGRRRPQLLGAARGWHPRRAQVVRAARRRRELRLRTAAQRLRPAMVSRRRQRARVAAAAGTAHLHRLVSARRARPRTARTRARRIDGARGGSGRQRAGRDAHDHGTGRVSAAVAAAARDDRASDGAGRRCRPWRPPARRAGRESRIRRCPGPRRRAGRARTGRRLRRADPARALRAPPRRTGARDAHGYRRARAPVRAAGAVASDAAQCRPVGGRSAASGQARARAS